METIKPAAEILPILKQGMEDISVMNEEVQVLNYVMNMCISHFGFQSGNENPILSPTLEKGGEGGFDFHSDP